MKQNPQFIIKGLIQQPTKNLVKNKIKSQSRINREQERVEKWETLATEQHTIATLVAGTLFVYDPEPQ